MSDELKRSVFQVIQGGSTPTNASSSSEADLQIVPRRARAAQQLGFPFVRATRMLISVGYDGLTHELLDRLLSAYMPTTFVDIRVSPSFNNQTLNREAVAHVFRSYQVDYFHLPELANIFIGESLDFRWSLEKYAASLADNSHLAELQGLIEQGPVVLLSRTHDHCSSERAVLVDELNRRWPAFQLVLPF